MEQKIQQTTNIGVVIGLLKSKEIKINTKDGKTYATGNIVVQVTNEYGISDLRIDVMQYELYNNGKENKAYKSLLTINDSYKTIKDDGVENADLIQVYVKVQENAYYSTDREEMIESIRLMATTDFDRGFYTPISRVKDINAKQVAKISFGGYISDIRKKEDGALDVDVIGVTYSGKAIKHRVQVEKELVAPFEGGYYVGCTTTLSYLMIDAVEMVKENEEVGLGEGAGLTVERRTRKNLVVGASPANPNGITQEQATHLLNMRKVEMDEKMDAAKKKQEEKTNVTFDVAFDVGIGGLGTPGLGFDGSSPYGM